jgi:hypothetical protein
MNTNEINFQYLSASIEIQRNRFFVHANKLETYFSVHHNIGRRRHSGDQGCGRFFGSRHPEVHQRRSCHGIHILKSIWFYLKPF